MFVVWNPPLIISIYDYIWGCVKAPASVHIKKDVLAECPPKYADP